jgi:hypothetical protein
MIYRCACPEGHHLNEPVDLSKLTKAQEAALVATLAFTYDPKGQHPPGASPQQSDGPADAGPPDSPEA